MPQLHPGHQKQGEADDDEVREWQQQEEEEKNITVLYVYCISLLLPSPPPPVMRSSRDSKQGLLLSLSFSHMFMPSYMEEEAKICLYKAYLTLPDVLF
jgi:hypothetical protein